MHWLWSILILAHEGHEQAADDAAKRFLAGENLVPLVVLVVGALATLLVIFFIFSKLRGKKSQHASTEEPMSINVGALPTGEPPTAGAQLEVYNVPMRLALLVLAPVGREGKIPSSEDLPLVVDAIVPNLMQVLNDHQPEFRRWPPQLSSQGFAQIFFNNVPLPGDAGKNTPWCSLAGRFDTPSGPFLAGLVCVAARPDAIGQTAIAQSGQWLDIMRVKT